jgi:hypothetical protein
VVIFQTMRACLQVASLLMLLAPACALKPPLQNTGAATAAGGIVMAVQRQSCDETVQPKQPGNDLVEAIVEVEIRNPSDLPLAVHRDRLRLIAPDGSSIRTSTWFASEPLTVAAAQSQTFQVRFMSRGGLSCWKPMELHADGAVMHGAAPLTLAAVRFTPSHALPGYGTPATP